ncbi:MAG: CD225/dispanin family protein [Bacteroidales bacterium]|nr:CD225/dispanin family protein [Bacteroidales bacterium]
MKKCPNCGYSNETGADTCKECGTHLHKTVHHHKKPMPPTYLWQSVVVTVFCCLPLGIVAIVFAAQVSSRWHGHDYDGAMHSSKVARNIAFFSFVIGLIVHITMLVYFVFVVGLLSGGILSHIFGG